MVKHRYFRLLGYLYGGTLLLVSVLFLIDSIYTWKANKSYESRYQYYRDTSSPFSWIICIIFDLYLIASIILQRVRYVERYLELAAELYVFSFFACGIVIGFEIAPSVNLEIGLSTTINDFSIRYIGSIVFSSGLYAITTWVLNGVIESIKTDLSTFSESRNT